MPTKKKIIQVVMDDETMVKFNALQKILKRRYASELASLIITEYIERYEAENGSLIN